jgi:hypothetical protein
MRRRLSAAKKAWLNACEMSMRLKVEMIGKWKWIWMQAFTDYWVDIGGAETRLTPAGAFALKFAIHFAF